MSTLITVIYALVFAIAFANRNNYQRIELLNYRFDPLRSDIANAQWHRWQAVIQAAVVGAIVLYSFFQPLWIDALLFVTLFWLVFDSTIGWLISGNIAYLGGGDIDGFFKQWKLGHVVKLLLQVILVLLTVVLYNFV